MDKCVTLPAGGVWTMTHAAMYNNAFIICTNPEHPPMLLGRTATGQLFVRKLTPAEQAMT
jgi:hypothetical protein